MIANLLAIPEKKDSPFGFQNGSFSQLPVPRLEISTPPGGLFFPLHYRMDRIGPLPARLQPGDYKHAIKHRSHQPRD
jgi:hypothetical protein